MGDIGGEFCRVDTGGEFCRVDTGGEVGEYTLLDVSGKTQNTMIGIGRQPHQEELIYFLASSFVS